MLYCTPPTQHVWSSGSLICGSNGMELHSRQWRRNESESGAAQRRNFFALCQASTVLALKIQLVVLVSVFRDHQYSLPVSCLLFFYSLCTPCPPIFNSGETCPLCHMESALLLADSVREPARCTDSFRSAQKTRFLNAIGTSSA